MRNSDSREASKAGAETMRVRRQEVKSDLGLMKEGLLTILKILVFFGEMRGGVLQCSE